MFSSKAGLVLASFVRLNPQKIPIFHSYFLWSDQGTISTAEVVSAEAEGGFFTTASVEIAGL